MWLTRSVDFRKGMDGLAALVRKTLPLDPHSRAVFVFRAKRADRVKILVLTCKRQEENRFIWPGIEDGVI